MFSFYFFAHLANKYNAIDLFNKCLDFVKLCSDNVFFIFAQARLYDIKVISISLEQANNSLLEGIYEIKSQKLSANFSLINIFLSFQQDLIKLCWTFIDKNAYAVFATNEFLQIDQDFLIELFGRDQLSVSEIAIWDAVSIFYFINP